MASLPTPQTPNFRITLFYGPEPVEGRQGIQRCVFNVKKRSWKAGVQVAVDLSDEQVVRAAARLRFDNWLAEVLRALPDDERLSQAARAHELFRQALASLKLDLAIEAGLSQENQQLEIGTLVPELDQRIAPSEQQIKSQILADLDLP